MSSKPANSGFGSLILQQCRSSTWQREVPSGLWFGEQQRVFACSILPGLGEHSAE